MLPAAPRAPPAKNSAEQHGSEGELSSASSQPVFEERADVNFDDEEVFETLPPAPPVPPVVAKLPPPAPPPRNSFATSAVVPAVTTITVSSSSRAASMDTSAALGGASLPSPPRHAPPHMPGAPAVIVESVSKVQHTYDELPNVLGTPQYELARPGPGITPGSDPRYDLARHSMVEDSHVYDVANNLSLQPTPVAPTRAPAASLPVPSADLNANSRAVTGPASSTANTLSSQSAAKGSTDAQPDRRDVPSPSEDSNGSSDLDLLVITVCVCVCVCVCECVRASVFVFVSV
jgi:hypothetical protein